MGDSCKIWAGDAHPNLPKFTPDCIIARLQYRRNDYPDPPGDSYVFRTRSNRSAAHKISLMAESLMDKELLERTETTQIFRPLPDLNIVKLGGQSIIDRGRQVVLPLIEEIVEIRKTYQLLVMTGGGTRSRHAYAIALDLGMPTGVLAKLGASISEQNALMISLLLAPYGGINIHHDDLVKMPSYLTLGIIPVMHAMPPYGLWEHPAAKGRIPPHRTDVGAFLTAEVLGSRRCILVKDEKGLFTADPKKDLSADFIPEIDVIQIDRNGSG